MTPQDFLDSLTLDEPRERTFRNVINKNQVKKFIQNTPPLRRGNSKMFSELGDKGIISYAEYLFLVTLLTSIFLLNLLRSNFSKVFKKKFRIFF
ncbi:unnamed protein product [Meloidogyne enterolobii]|uniref:Uncharacterized protein n=1 Tax=Meloidogyne enterolobii TaxID=390850 RepID=A0ACB1AJ50_MELEN